LRDEDAADQLTCDCHPSFRPVPLGVAVNGSSLSFMDGERLPMATLVPAHA